MFQGNPFQTKQRNPHDFERVPKVQTQRSSFNRSHGVKTAFDSGYLVPFYADEVLPGDTHSLKLTAVARLSTPIVPFMDNLQCDFFFFYVPLRLVWSNFKKMMGEQANPADSISYICPISTVNTATGYAVGSLQDYLGLPTDIDDYSHNVFHTRAYNLIWNEWFRDENLQNSVTVDTGDGPDTTTNYVLKKRGKRFDYFTSCLPWPQKATAVSMPIGGYSNVIPTSTPVAFTLSGVSGGAYTGSSYQMIARNGPAAWDTSSLYAGTAPGTADKAAAFHTGTATGLRADLSTATGATINELRQSLALQALYERDARGGTRYTEIIKSHFGVTSPDARLQRPEILGTGRSMINLHAVPQTSPTSGSNAQGALSAFGTMSANGIGFTKSFDEHGVILGIACVTADLTYQQGLERMYSRSTKTDFFWPSLEGIGEQAVLNKEIYLQGAAGGAADATTFGYQERYAEYKYKPSIITGKLRSTASGTLDLWHLAQKFTALPTLGDTFITENPPVSRVVAVNTEPQIIMDAYMQLNSVRPMATYAVPGLKGIL